MTQIAGDRWYVDNLVDTATITGASLTPALGPQRLADPRLGVVWRPADIDSEVTFTFQQPTRVQAIGVFGVKKPTPTSVIRFNLDLTLPDASPDPRSGLWEPDLDVFTEQGIWLSDLLDPLYADTPVASVKLAFAFDSALCDIGRVWIGSPLWEPTINHTYGSEQGLEDLSTVQRTRRSGAVFADTARRLRTASVTYDAIDPVEWAGPVRTLGLTAGTSKQVLFVPDPSVYDPTKETILGYQEQLNPITTLGFQRFQKAFDLKEAG